MVLCPAESVHMNGQWFTWSSSVQVLSYATYNGNNVFHNNWLNWLPCVTGRYPVWMPLTKSQCTKCHWLLCLGFRGWGFWVSGSIFCTGVLGDGILSLTFCPGIVTVHKHWTNPCVSVYKQWTSDLDPPILCFRKGFKKIVEQHE